MGTIKEGREIIALIPAGGGTRDVYGRELNYPSALELVNGSPILIKIVDQLISNGVLKIRIGIKQQYKPLFENVLLRFLKIAEIQLIDVTSSQTPVNTLQLISVNLNSSKSVIVNFGDTFCEFEFTSLFEADCGVVIQEVSENENWSTVKTDEKDTVLASYEKASISGSLTAQCGIYWWKDSSNLISTLNNIDQLSEINELVTASLSLKIQAIVANSWIDSDHSTYREESSLNLIEARSFNQINMDRFRGVITKKSQNHEKLIREIEYYENIPTKLKIFFPRMLKSSKKNGDVFQELEYYPYPNLSSLFVYQNVPKHIWRKILSKLKQTLTEEFACHQEETNHYDLEEIFVKRTSQRIENLLETEETLKSLISAQELTINGEVFPGLSMIIQEAAQVVSKIDSAASFIHGDFCLSNILCDLDSFSFKFIDPRGGFDSPSCYGPKIYDVAKLGHSIIGGYDFIISDQFRVEIESEVSQRYKIELFQSSAHREIQDIFYEIFVHEGLSKNQIELVSGLILIGVASFHVSHPSISLGLLLRGVEVSGQAMKEYYANMC